MSRTPEELAALQSSKLARWLIEQAKDARAFVLEDDFLSLREVFTTVRTAAGLAKGPNRDLLEVAEAFFAPLARNQLSRQQIELRQFLKTGGEPAEEFLRHLVDEKSIEVEAQAVRSLHTAVARLEELGVLISQDGFLRVVPAAEAFVRELVDPLAFRLWAKVEQARREAAVSPEAQRSLLLAGHLGVTERQAKRFLLKHVQPRRSAGAEPTGDLVVPHGGMVDQRSNVDQTASLTRNLDSASTDELRASITAPNGDRDRAILSTDRVSA